MIVTTTPQLAELVTAYQVARDTAAEAAKRKDAIADQLKQAMLAQAQAENPTDPLTDTELIAGPVKATLVQQTRWTLDTGKLKAEYPAVYAAYARQSSTLVLNLKLA